jgi:uncharacterized protein (TIGR00297 family)
MSLQVMLLDVWGIIAAIIVGVLIYWFGGAMAMEYLALMLVFLICGTFVTLLGREKKEDLGIYEYGRSWQNVLANGIVPVAAILIHYPPAYFGAVAGIAADKFSSEIGALGGEPVFLGNFKRVKRGTSGAVSGLGTVAGFVGAEIVAISVYVLFPGVSMWQALLLPFTGLLGSMVDSLAGIFETRGLGSKATSNLAGAIAGAILGALLFTFVR